MTHHLVMAVLSRGETVLLCHRHPERDWYPDVWDLPGGHVEPDEPPDAALARELREELGIEVGELDEPLLGVRFGDVDALVWHVREWHGDVTNRSPDEHDLLAWFPLAEIDTLATADPMIGELCRLAIEDG